MCNYGVLGRNIVINKSQLSSEQKELLTITAEELKREIQGKVKTSTITKTGKLRKPRATKESDNPYRELFEKIGNYDNMPFELSDIFAGSSRLTTSNTLVKPWVIFGLLKKLHNITTETVYVCGNRGRIKAERYSQDYAQQLAKACRSAIKCFDFYHENINEYYKREEKQRSNLDSENFSFTEDAKNYAEYEHTEQTDEHKRELLEGAGLTESEIEHYLVHGRLPKKTDIALKVAVRCRLKPKNITEYNNKGADSLKWLPQECSYVDLETGELIAW